jgi:hypothetical protein
MSHGSSRWRPATSRDCLPDADYIFVSHGCCQALIAALGSPVAPGVYRLAP